MKINQYDRVKLIDGRVGCIVEVNSESNSFDIDVGDSPEDWDTLHYVPLDQIEKVLNE